MSALQCLTPLPREQLSTFPQFSAGCRFLTSLMRFPSMIFKTGTKELPSDLYAVLPEEGMVRERQTVEEQDS